MRHDTLDATLDALANVHRRSIVVLLVDGPMTTPALGAHFAMSKQALNRHIGVLEAAQLIERRRRGRVVEIALRGHPLDQVVDWIGTVRQAWESSLDRLGDVLAEEA